MPNIKYRADLHLHTDASDGSVSADVLVARASLIGLNLLSVTEHDNVHSWPKVRSAARRNNIQVIPGIEVSTSYLGHGVHLLGYDFSPNSKPLHDLIDYQFDLRVSRIKNMLNRLADIGIKIPFARLRLDKTSAPGRVHVAQSLAASGVVLSVEDAFRKYLKNGRPGYVPLETVTPEEAIGVIHDSGGFTSLAHPIFTEDKNRLRNNLTSMGLDAIEVMHPKHTLKFQNDLIRFCKSKGLMMTGGSDWHGTLGEKYDLGDWYLKVNGPAQVNRLSSILKNSSPCRPEQRRKIVV